VVPNCGHLARTGRRVLLWRFRLRFYDPALVQTNMADTALERNTDDSRSLTEKQQTELLGWMDRPPFAGVVQPHVSERAFIDLAENRVYLTSSWLTPLALQLLA
jgi:hypothetical protein